MTKHYIHTSLSLPLFSPLLYSSPNVYITTNDTPSTILSNKPQILASCSEISYTKQSILLRCAHLIFKTKTQMKITQKLAALFRVPSFTTFNHPVSCFQTQSQSYKTTICYASQTHHITSPSIHPFFSSLLYSSPHVYAVASYSSPSVSP